MVLTPAYLGSAIAEEKERRTLELLFTTHLNNTEIILGKLISRVIHLVGFVIAGLPILSLIQFWGGIDMLLIAGNLVNTILNIISIGSVCLLASVLARSVTAAVMTSYAVILPIGFCCVVSLRGFPFVLQDARSGGAGNVSVQDLGVLCVVHLVIVTGFLSLAIAALREHEPLGAVLPPAPERYDVSEGPTRIGRREAAPLDPTAVQAEVIHVTTKPMPKPIIEPPRPIHQTEPENEFSIPYTLPPVPDNALLWKERFVGGPPWFFSPVVLVPALPFLVTGFLVLGFWFLRSLFLNRDEYRRAVEGWAIVLRFLYYCGLGAYLLGVGFRAAGCVARERQQQTLDPLLLLPIDRSEILATKLWGALIRGWPWLILIAGNIAFGTLLGAYHPFSAVLLCTAPWVVVLFIAGLGLFLSVEMDTVLRANLLMLIIVILLAAISFLLPIGLGPMTFLEPLAFTLWGEEQGVGGGFAPDGMNWNDPSRLVQPRIFSGIVTVAYIAGGTILLLLAFRLFDRRVKHAES
jgi:ABC-type transport system involved in multi-copper enzyme maturation permease subunit